MNLLDSIFAQLKEQPMPFVNFMHQALYTPNLGYYSAGLQKFGKHGDFITAPELTPLFGQTLANFCLPLLKGLKEPILFEFGAGTGQLCVDILTQLECLQQLPHAYHILEVSGYLQQQQQDLVHSKIPHLAHCVKWITQWPTQAFNGVVIANEVLDAMPVHRFLQTSEGILESYVTFTDQGELTEVFQPCVNPLLVDHVRNNVPRETYPYQSEVNLFIDDWMRQCHAMIEQGTLLIIDYGFPRHEYYHPDRQHGTLMCHYRHQAHTNPFVHVGEQDITAHVDFTHVADAAYHAGFHVAGYTNQAAFLLANDILNLLSQSGDTKEHIRHQQAVKQLLQPSEMGELFKVIALTKKIESPLSGFQLHDKRASL